MTVDGPSLLAKSKGVPEYVDSRYSAMRQESTTVVPLSTSIGTCQAETKVDFETG